MKSLHASLQRRWLLGSGLLSLLMLLTACTSPRMERQLNDKPIGKVYQPVNVYSPERLPAGLQRVVVLPPHTENLRFSFMDGVYQELLTALRTEGRFQIIPVPENELREIVGQPSLAPEDPLPRVLVTRLQQRYRANGILLLHISAFRPYKPMVLGLRGHLAALPSGNVLWSCDEVFDAGNKLVTRGARKYSEKYVEQAYPLQSSYSSLLSPQRFAAYVGYTVFRTLPPRS